MERAAFMQSKDRVPVGDETNTSRNSSDAADRVTCESLDEPVSRSTCMGSFASLRMTEVSSMKEHEYFVYIMASRSGTLYIGITNSIYRRVLEHKRGEIEGFASKYGCIRLVYYYGFDDVHKAIGREKQLKGWTRAKKIALIESKNPRWEDLAEKWGAEMLFAGESMKGR